MYKLIGIFLISIIFVGCTSKGRITQTTLDPATGSETTVELSEYFESKNMIAGGQLQAHIIVTLGAERIPKGYLLTEEVNRSQDQIEEVIEIYFTNKGTQPVSIKNVYLQANSRKLDILPTSITVQPNKWVKSEPVIGVTSVYRPDIDSILHYEYNGKNLTAALPQKRTPVSELRGK